MTITAERTEAIENLRKHHMISVFGKLHLVSDVHVYRSNTTGEITRARALVSQGGRSEWLDLVLHTWVSKERPKAK